MKLFPIGTLSSGNGYGLIDSVQYSFFEPNKSAKSSPVHTSLQTRFQTQTILTRKTAEPYLNIAYEYADIFAREYQQIEAFIDDVEDAVNSFYVIDLSKGEVPSAVSSWVVSITNTRLYSSVSNMKSNWVFFYNGVSWKLGEITSITTNTSITCSVTADYGTLTSGESAVVTGNQRTFIYPVYCCYLVPNQLNSFKRTGYWPNKDTEDYGPMYSGSINFVSKYKV